ncbi:MAG: hypothetical protein ACRCYA_09360, partial [Cetobacterium sp.]|uniref:hypothetical protein n=1 Tax=Cetobacterium sp. TaxID=2071632 RepID=UPI003F39A9A8
MVKEEIDKLPTINNVVEYRREKMTFDTPADFEIYKRESGTTDADFEDPVDIDVYANQENTFSEVQYLIKTSSNLNSIVNRNELNNLAILKQDKLKAGENITITSDNTISATGGGTGVNDH